MSLKSLTRSRVGRAGLIVLALAVGSLIAVACAPGQGAQSPGVAAGVEATPSQNASGPLLIPHDPRVAFETTKIDLGNIPVGDRVPVTFVYRNTGNAPLVVGEEPTIEAQEGCWPPTPVVGATTLQPGEEGTISVTMHMPKGMGGPHHFVITVETNDPAHPQVVLDLIADFIE